MILPGKHLSSGRCLLGVSSEILVQLAAPRDVSGLWEAFRAARAGRERNEPVSFDWFVAALTFLYTLGAVEMRDGLIVPGEREP